ncbi:MAG TPA: Gfo/Idh/MocA family oxidoreductase [Phycisphaerae bacterium]|nr:Gfo/Idh/MocA family oxidoreductase [Phycisphaerae bacterium]HRY71009.1 Gfo/Idh/MocA family oxidoreductase [Phycisphaerae bacterium]HSA29301.1 Gfo/Idh/MocA family oxidoreductase [Phycisphaerae bacterium]
MSSSRPDSRTHSRSRRDLLKISAAGAATLSMASHVHAAGDETIRIGMIGSGGRCTDAAAQSMAAGRYVKLVAMCDVFHDKVLNSRKHLKEKYPEQVQVDDDHCFAGLDGYKKVIESADLVLIACASKFHPMYSEVALQAGKHVFVEKPHGIDPVGVKRMRAACELAKEKGLSLLSGLQSRWHAGYQECIKRIHDGVIGDVVAIQCMFLRAPYVVVPRNPQWTEMEYHFRNWYHFCWLSGDDVPQSLVHNFDRASWALKEEMPKWAFGLAGRSASFGEQYGDMFDHHAVVYEYDSGPRVYALCRTQTGAYGNFSDIVMGTKGTCYLGDCRIEGETKWKHEGQVPDPCLVEQKALIEAIRNRKPINSGYHMVGSTMATVLGQLVCYDGRSHTMTGAWKSQFSHGPLPEKTTLDMEPPTKPDRKTGEYPLPLPGVTKMME